MVRTGANAIRPEREAHISMVTDIHFTARLRDEGGWFMMMGGVGWMSGPACVIPRQSVELYELARNRLWEKAFLLQKRLWDINRVFQKYSLANCIKACLELQGFAVGGPIPPLQPLSGLAIREIEEVLNGLEVL